MFLVSKFTNNNNNNNNNSSRNLAPFRSHPVSYAIELKNTVSFLLVSWMLVECYIWNKTWKRIPQPLTSMNLAAPRLVLNHSLRRAPRHNSVGSRIRTGLGGKSNWLVVFRHPFEKYARQIGNLAQIGMKIKNIWNHHLANHADWSSVKNSSNHGNRMNEQPSIGRMLQMFAKYF